MPELADAVTPAHPPTLAGPVVHASLYRSVLLAGVEPSVVVLEATTAFALVFGVGLHVATVLLAVFYLTVVHAVMVWVATRDAPMSVLSARTLSARDFSPPHASVHAAPPPVHPSMPQGR